MKNRKMPWNGQKKSVISIRWLVLATISIFVSGSAVFAANTPTLNQTINAGSLSVDIVDDSGNTVGSPSVAFSAANYSFDNQDGTGTLGTASEKIRVYNPTSTETWTVNLAGSATTALWTDGGNTYDFNDGSGYSDGGDTDAKGGQMTINPSAGTLAGVSGCATTNVSKGASDSFIEGSVNSIDLMSAAAGAATFCRWDLTGVALTQKIPASQPAGSYSISMTMTIS